MRSRRIDNFLELWWLVASRVVDIVEGRTDGGDPEVLIAWVELSQGVGHRMKLLQASSTPTAIQTVGRIPNIARRS